MRVTQECEGCLHCTWETYDDSGRYEPGYYCDLDKCYMIDLEGDE